MTDSAVVGTRPQTRGDADARAAAARPPLPVLALVVAPLAVLGAAAALSNRHDLSQVVEAVLLVAWAAVALLLVARRQVEQLASLVAVGAAAAAVGVFGGAAGGAGGDRVAAVVAPLVPALAMHLLLSLPDGRLVRGGERLLTASGYAIGAALAVALAANGRLVLWPVVLEGAAMGAAGLAGGNARYRRMTLPERKRVQWFGCALAIVAEGLLVLVALRVLTGWPSHVLAIAGLLTLVLPAALAAGTSPRLTGRVDRILASSVSLAGLSGVVVGVYLGVVLGLGRPPRHAERTVLVLSMLAAALAAALYLPARERLTRFSNRLVYGERRAPDEVLRTFGSRLSRAVPLDELLLQLAESLRKTLELSEVQVWTGSEGILDRAVSLPELGPARLALGPAERPVIAEAGVSGAAWARIWLPQLVERGEDAIMRVVPVTNSGELLGLIVVERKVDAEPFDSGDDQMLTDLARQVGLALHNVRLDSALQASLDEVRRQAEELQASRARIVAASNEARRQIERNLHDGAQQHLVALAVNLRLAQQLIGADGAQAAEMLDQLGGDLQEAIQQLRELAHGIYPPLLMDRGLAAALAAALARSPLPSELEAGDDVGRYPAELEAAAYFCCLEALQNAAKHAGPGATVTVRLCEQPDGLVFEVSDTGAGFDAGAKGHGAGFVNMADRLGAIGGTLRVESAPGKGTTIRGLIPLAA